MKLCNTCGEWKNAAAFNRDKAKRDGLCSQCRACVRAYQSTETFLERKRQRDRAVRHTRNEYMQKYAWHKKNPERAKAHEDKWRKGHPDQMKAKWSRRRARENGGAHFSGKEWAELREQYQGACLRCGRHEPEIRLTADHVVPLDKGGSNAITNIQPLCKSCNSAKGTKSTDYRMKGRGTEGGLNTPA